MTVMESKADARKRRNDRVRAEVGRVLLDIDGVERTGMAVARVRFVQLARQAAARLNLKVWSSKAQGLQEAGEESLGRFLDGEWRAPRGGGEPRFGNTNEEWVLDLWEAAVGQWDLERSKPRQSTLLEAPPSFSERLSKARHEAVGWHNLESLVVQIENDLRRQGL